MSSSSRTRRGLTLVEVLATVSIIAIVIPVVMQGISIASGLASITKQKAQAVSLAETKLNELILTGDWQTAATSGDFSPTWPEFRWEASSENWEESDMFLLQVKVQWVSRGHDREVVLSTLVYEPVAEGSSI